PKLADWASLVIPSDASPLERLTYVPGVVGEIVDWIVSTAPRPNRMMALVVALGIVGTLIGRKVRGPTGTATHTYDAIIGITGMGKDHPLKCGQAIMKEVAPDLLGPGEFASGPGFIKRLRRNPLMICFIDEFGDELDKIKNHGGNPWLK